MSGKAISVHRGTVIKFHDSKGYGFIRPEDEGPDAFVHYSSILMDGEYQKLIPGQKVEFKLIDTDKGPAAVEVRAIA